MTKQPHCTLQAAPWDACQLCTWASAYGSACTQAGHAAVTAKTLVTAVFATAFLQASSAAHSLQFFLYFGVIKAIKHMFAMPEFVKARATSRTTTDQSTWWGSPNASAINEKIGHVLLNPDGSPNLDNSTYSLAFDFVNTFNFKDWSTGVVMMR